MGAGQAGMDDIDHQFDVFSFEQGRAQRIAGADPGPEWR